MISRVKILESYLAPTSFSLDGAQVRRVTWLLAVRVLDDELWAQIKSGELTALDRRQRSSRLTCQILPHAVLVRVLGTVLIGFPATR